MKLLRLLVLLLVLPTYAQQGGMWIPSLLKGMNQKEMKSLGMRMSASDIYDVNNSSLKDAVPHFNGGCTSEVISSQGLLLTNHHCGYGEIQAHSTIDHDYLTDGFWAMTMEEELANPGMEVTFIVRIEDVTNQVLEGVSSLGSEEEKQQKIQQNITSTTKSFKKESYQENKIRTFYEGNQYMLFVTETYKDVRLVGAPPSSIGKFGSDTDNWVWPRHTGDFSLFRIYANKDNLPAEYSKDNVPYTPKHFLPVSLGGVEEDDFTLVFGYPGRTQEYLPSVAVAQIVDVLNPAKIAIRDAALKVTDGFMRKDKQIKIQYASKYASIANYWKKWIGESQGLKKSNAVAVKKAFEKDFLKRAKKAGKMDEYGNLFKEFDKYYSEREPYQLSRDYFIEIAIRNTELLTIGYKLYQLERIHAARGEQSFNDRRNNTVKSLEGTYKDYSKQVDEKVFEKLIELYATKSPQQFLPELVKGKDYSAYTKEVYGQSQITSYEGVKALLAGDGKTVIEQLNNDKGYQVVKAMMETYIEKVAPKYEELTLKIDALQRTYMKGILELSPKDARIFPD
ncbi:S46 family peptidase, partial [uncultured Flavobacterium sp.]|uniref:S46 family peptidase n=1 Tax=uncultured Flavobacterium sp. TaxID=165435 RepID=UPI0025D46982